MSSKQYEKGYGEFSGAYSIDGWAGIAWHILGWKLSPIAVWSCPDCGALGFEREHGGGATTDKGDPACDHANAFWEDEPDYERTGQLIAVMIGDDRHFTVDPSDIHAIAENDYCPECGQIGCHCYR
jgi:hypothetical protein